MFYNAVSTFKCNFGLFFYFFVDKTVDKAGNWGKSWNDAAKRKMESNPR